MRDGAFLGNYGQFMRRPKEISQSQINKFIEKKNKRKEEKHARRTIKHI